jgi:hypothetical protein
MHTDSGVAVRALPAVVSDSVPVGIGVAIVRAPDAVARPRAVAPTLADWMAVLDLLTTVIPDPQRIAHSGPARVLMGMLDTFNTVRLRRSFAAALADWMTILCENALPHIWDVTMLTDPPLRADTVVEQVSLGICDAVDALVCPRASTATQTLRVTARWLATIYSAIIPKPPIMTPTLPCHILIRILHTVVTLINPRSKTACTVRITNPSIHRTVKTHPLGLTLSDVIDHFCVFDTFCALIRPRPAAASTFVVTGD